MRKFATMLLLGLLAGCAHTIGIVQISPDTYILTREDHAGIFAFNRGKLKIDAIREANAFAEEQGKIAIPVSMHEHPCGVLGDWPAVEYQFKVVSKDDPEARRTSLIPRADVVLEKTEKISADINVREQSEKTKDIYTELIKLEDLRQKGIINDTEFESLKKKLLETK